ncbi:hypothetical protein [Paracoccus sp. (in: a-proteobacteria)]|uniref:hypothetical protein n=1 Tax=Paracoccus sp. TaxID=267 RepID=UPI00396C72BA
MRPRNSRVEKAHFLVYSNGIEPFAANADNYCASALKVGFDSATHVTETMLKDTPLWTENRTILEQSRGAGYWLWKPWIILQKLRECGPSDIVVYNDAGRYTPGEFHQFPSFPHAAVELCALTPKRFIHGFISNWQVQGHYTKRDAFILMEADTDEMHRAAQVCAGPLLFMPSDESFAFLERWLHYCRDPRILTDQPDETGRTLPSFRDHRHDQAVGSILAHRTGAHYFDFSSGGAYRALEEIRQRNRHVPWLQTHIGYVSLVAAQAMPDDFLVRDDPDLSELSHLLRNLVPGEPVPVHADKVPDSVMVAELEELLQSPQPMLCRDHLMMVLDENKVVNGRLHVLNKFEDEAPRFWDLACRAFRDRAAAAHQGGQTPTVAQAPRLAVAALRDAEAAMPDLRRKVMGGYVWTLLSDDARAIFKSAHKNVKSPKGAAAMDRFVMLLDELGFMPLQAELDGKEKPLSEEVSRRLMDWMLVDAGPSSAVFDATKD